MIFKHYLEIVILLSWLAAGLVYFGFVRRWGKAVTAMLLLSLTLSYIQYFTTVYTHDAFDVGGHTAYVATIATTGKLPTPMGWQSQQPPLYYIIAACFYKFGEWSGMQDPFNAARIFSLILYTGFLLLSIATLRCYLSGGYFIMASAIMLFWPDGFTYAGRISNDLGMLVSHALTLYLATRWYYSKESRFMLYACYSAIAGLLIKSSAIMGLGAMAILIVRALLRHEVSYRAFLNKKLIGFGLFSVGVNFGRIAYYRWVEHANVKWFINLELGQIPSFITNNTPYDFLYFDVAGFLRDPFYFSAYPKGSEFFWNAFLKTLLLGEWTWNAGPIVAAISSALLLVIVAYVVTYLLFKTPTAEKDLCLPALALMLCMLVALIGARIQVPWAAQCSGRYVFGITVILALFFSRAVEWHRRQGRTALALLGAASAIAFSTVSIIMIVCEFYDHL